MMMTTRRTTARMTVMPVVLLSLVWSSGVPSKPVASATTAAVTGGRLVGAGRMQWQNGHLSSTAHQACGRAPASAGEVAFVHLDQRPVMPLVGRSQGGDILTSDSAFPAPYVCGPVDDGGSLLLQQYVGQ